jgi:capsular polysaccharide transport system permease protein
MTPADDRPATRPDLRAVPDPAADPAAAEGAPADPGRPARRRRAAREETPDEAPRKRGRRRRSRSRAERAAALAVPHAALVARPRPRHWGLLAGFAALVLLPALFATAYLYLRAADQYHSEVAFSVRSEEVASASAGILGALTQIGTGTATDADILFEYIRSPEIVEAIGARLDLRAIWNRAEADPVFTLGEERSAEALLDHWRRMVEVAYDSNTGIIHVEARAFTPEDARAIAGAVLAESGALVNQLSEQAREDAVRFAREELAEAEEHLRAVRQSLAEFRRTHNIVDPSADVAGQMGLLSALNQELAQALVERDVLLSYASEDDQRVLQANRRIDAITAQIEDERSSLDLTGVTGSLPEVVGRYEELLVDLEFANTAYTQALAGLAAARAEARRQSRYLAPHIRPTLATSALYPRRALLAGLTGLFLLLGWGALMLVYYNVRDNR